MSKEEDNLLPVLSQVKKSLSHEQYNYFNEHIGHEKITSNSIQLSKEVKELFAKANEKLDKYYTKPSVADYCYSEIKKLLNSYGKDLSQVLFIEPSAGSGVFLNSIQEKKIGFDIAPTVPDIIKNDFLSGNVLKHLSKEQKNKLLVFIGNPPFGSKSKLAIDFLNKSLEYSNIVGFIVPLQFRKWSVQSKINKNAKLLLDLDLQENAFEFLGKDYKVRCCFQVWALDGFSKSLSNLRILGKPIIKHPDFEMYQYNRTTLTERYFDYDWDFAVIRQGYYDYNFKAFSKMETNRKQQWIFFKAKNNDVLKNLLSLDFVKLSKKNIGIPGFGKADVIQEYLNKFIDDELN